MAKTFSQYAAERRARASHEEALAFDVFDRAYTLGHALAEARRVRGMNQRELAACTGVNQADISRIERGLLSPTTPTLIKLTQGLNAKISIELLPGDVRTSHLIRTLANAKAAGASKTTTAPRASRSAAVKPARKQAPSRKTKV